ncbi:MAG: hypothetical protein LLG13_11005 [Bacteroidales bacterium]|nr:hypothetical protein [Bacteroidales bacterium]
MSKWGKRRKRQKKIESVEDIFVIAASRISLTPEQFLEYTPQELSGVLFYCNKTKDAEFQSNWERTRVQTYFLISIQLDKKNKLSYKKFKDEIWPFFWEQETKKVSSTDGIMTVQQWQELINKPIVSIKPA